MKIVQTLEDLPDEILDKRLFKGAIVGEQTRDRTTRNVFQKDVQELVVERGICMQRYSGGNVVKCTGTYKGTAQYSRVLDS